MKPAECPDKKTNVAIFASGAGSNAREIIRYFQDHPVVNIALVVSNKPEAGVLNIGQDAGIPTLIISRERFFNGDGYLPELTAESIGFIVLAGFLWKVPNQLIETYPQRIINIHPALLPSYGGKGMYGEAVHQAVIEAGEKESGITIHYVDGHYDNGDIIFQARCDIQPSDTPATLAEKIHRLEHRHYAAVIENILK